MLTYSGTAGAQLKSITDAMGKTTAFTYNSAGLLSSFTNARSEETDFTYDASHRVTQVDRKDSSNTSTTRLSYVSSTSTQVVDGDTSTSVSVASAPHVTYTIDSATQLVTKAVDQKGRVRSATYNGNLDALTSTSGAGRQR